MYKFQGKKNQHARTFTNQKISMQQVQQTNCVQKARNKFQEQNQFIEEKYQQATSFTNKNQHARSSKNNISFKRRRISMQQVSQTIVITQQVQ